MKSMKRNNKAIIIFGLGNFQGRGRGRLHDLGEEQRHGGL
jgi:hypothetical protein